MLLWPSTAVKVAKPISVRQGLLTVPRVNNVVLPGRREDAGKLGSCRKGVGGHKFYGLAMVVRCGGVVGSNRSPVQGVFQGWARGVSLEVVTDTLIGGGDRCSRNCPYLSYNLDSYDSVAGYDRWVHMYSPGVEKGPDATLET